MMTDAERVSELGRRLVAAERERDANRNTALINLRQYKAQKERADAAERALIEAMQTIDTLASQELDTFAEAVGLRAKLAALEDKRASNE